MTRMWHANTLPGYMYPSFGVRNGILLLMHLRKCHKLTGKRKFERNFNMTTWHIVEIRNPVPNVGLLFLMGWCRWSMFWHISTFVKALWITWINDKDIVLGRAILRNSENSSNTHTIHINIVHTMFKLQIQLCISYIQMHAWCYGLAHRWNLGGYNRSGHLVLIGSTNQNKLGSYSTHWGLDKMAAISRRHFQTHFLEWKCLNFD